ncbi:hypothetical protein, partial [Enterococcus faecium]|uniref:hypothetical protein n=1 Tax=Enterococcus faecium TaxID=1352 RepID=UPI003F42F820
KLIDGYSFVLFKDKLKTNNRLQRSILIIDKRLFLYKMFRQQLVNNPIPQNEQILELTNQKIVEMQDYLNHMVAIRLPWRVSYVLRVAATI